MAYHLDTHSTRRRPRQSNTPGEESFSEKAAKREVRQKIASILHHIRRHLRDYDRTGSRARSLQSQVLLLANIRNDVGENINQALHHHAVVMAVEYLRERYAGLRFFKGDVHPEQTGGADDPDIRGRAAGKGVICAEVTAHLRPQGYVDTRIKDALHKLTGMSCSHRYYFVTTSGMKQRADTKLSKMDCDIKVVLIDAGFDAIVEEATRKGHA